MPYTPAACGTKGLPGPAGRGIHRQAALQHRRWLKRMAPVPRPSCFYSREGLTLKPTQTRFGWQGATCPPKSIPPAERRLRATGHSSPGLQSGDEWPLFCKVYPAGVKSNMGSVPRQREGGVPACAHIWVFRVLPGSSRPCYTEAAVARRCDQAARVGVRA